MVKRLHCHQGPGLLEDVSHTKGMPIVCTGICQLGFLAAKSHVSHRDSEQTLRSSAWPPRLISKPVHMLIGCCFERAVEGYICAQPASTFQPEFKCSSWDHFSTVLANTSRRYKIQVAVGMCREAHHDLCLSYRGRGNSLDCS